MGIFPGLILRKVSDIPRNGLVAEYLFNGNYLDTSGSGLDGVNNGTTFINDRHGSSNSAITLNGSSNFVDVPFVTVSGTPCTFSAWVKTTMNTLGRIVLIHDRNTGNNQLSLFINAAGKAACQHAEGTGSSVAVGSTSIRDDVWYHVLATFDGISRREIFVNGTSEDTNTDARVALSGIDYTAIGYIDWSTGNIQFFDGDIDNIRIYNRVLTQDEITILANE